MTIGILLSYHRVARQVLDPWGLRVSPENFEEQMSLLRQFGSPISLPDFASSYQGGTAPERAIIITFDDGYLENFTQALPLLNQFAVPATVFISSAYIGKDYFWWEAVEQVFLRPNRLPQTLVLQLDSGPVKFELGDAAYYSCDEYDRDCVFRKWRGEPGSRIRSYHDVYDFLWSLDHRLRLLFVKDIIIWAGLNQGCFSDSRPMTAGEIRNLVSSGLITIGAHSVNHVPLDEKSTFVQESEILESRQDLEHLLNQPVVSFAYPHGKFNDETVAILKNNGFLCACTTRESGVERSTDPMILPRYTVKDWTNEEFMAKLSTWL